MEFINFTKIRVADNSNLDDTLKSALDHEYKNLPNYEFDDQIEDGDEYLTTYISILVPFNNYHVIITIHFADGSFEIKVHGIITGQSKLRGLITLCNLWFKDHNKVHYQIIDEFWGNDDSGDPTLIDHLFITEKTIHKIIELILDYYLGGSQPMYQCNPDCEEEKSLEI